MLEVNFLRAELAKWPISLMMFPGAGDGAGRAAAALDDDEGLVAMLLLFFSPPESCRYSFKELLDADGRLGLGTGIFDQASLVSGSRYSRTSRAVK